VTNDHLIIKRVIPVTDGRDDPVMGAGIIKINWS